MFGKTAVLAEFDKTQSFNSLEQTIQTINKLNKFDLKTISAPNLGLEVSTVSNATASTPRIGFGFRNSIGLLIESDFE